MKNSPKKSANPSGVVNKKYAEVLGGFPSRKSVEQIDKDVKPRANGSAPGSVRK